MCHAAGGVVGEANAGTVPVVGPCHAPGADNDVGTFRPRRPSGLPRRDHEEGWVDGVDVRPLGLEETLPDVPVGLGMVGVEEGVPVGLGRRPALLPLTLGGGEVPPVPSPPPPPVPSPTRTCSCGCVECSHPTYNVVTHDPGTTLASTLVCYRRGEPLVTPVVPLSMRSSVPSPE